MADTIWLKTGYDLEEADELRGISSAIAGVRGQVAPDIDRALAAFDEAMENAPPPEAELAAETFARTLRSLWLISAGREAASVYRSPTAGETERIARRHDGFGYERDLQPESLEQRCASFFPAPPEGWRQDHILFSSGQAAMTSALLVLGRRLAPGGEQVRLMHRGAYFETRQLIANLRFLTEATFAQTADIVVHEPVSCDGHFHRFDTSKLLSASPRAVVFDTTLLGRKDGVAEYLAACRTPGQTVIRVASCLKLLQGGFELANAGVLSVYTREADSTLADDIRIMRTLTGSGLHLVDALSLEAPWVFDAGMTDAYAASIFAHNARLAQAVNKMNLRFQPVAHPSFADCDAPFCAFMLKDASPEACDRLEAEIEHEARERQLNLVKGGSFGFRAHRFEIVKPETGDPPFLRVAMGRRAGWSCDGVIRMMTDIAANRR